MKKLVIVISAICLLSEPVRSQSFAVSTNAADWGWFLTPGAGMQYAVSRHCSLELAAKFNGWTWHDGDSERRNRQARQEYSFGLRYWPWYVYSGWWAAARLQYREYSVRPFDDIRSKEEGDGFGVALSGGYSLSVCPWFNIDFGLGFWTGFKYYKVYSSSSEACPECGRRTDSDIFSDKPSTSFFILPNELTIGAMFIF